MLMKTASDCTVMLSQKMLAQIMQPHALGSAGV
jgi:hypothetical protein